MTDLLIPEDRVAERATVGIALLTAVGARRAAAVVSAGDFYQPSLGRLFQAALMLDEITTWPVSGAPSSYTVRCSAAALIADEPDVEVEKLTDEAPTMTMPEPWAMRVADAARRRRAMAAAADAFNSLGSGASVEDVRPLLEEVIG